MKMQFLPGSLEIDNSPYDVEFWEEAIELLKNQEGYFAYKIPVLGTSSSADVPSFIAVTKKHGITLIDILHEPISSIIDDGRVWKLSNDSFITSRDVVLEHYQDEIHSRLKHSKSLYNRRKKGLSVEIKTLIIFRENSIDEIEKIDQEELVLSEFLDRDYSALLPKYFPDDAEDKLTEQQFDDILSLIEGTWDYQKLSTPTSEAQKPLLISEFINLSLSRTFKQDSSQRQVSMQIPNGPQRIRGLAGTGKTVVLSLKAALTALRKPEYRILYLFNTQSLYHTIGKQITDYYAKEAKKGLPEGAIDIFHAWGGRTSGEGLYSSLCRKIGISPLTLRDLPRGSDQLETIYSHVDKYLEEIEPIYDLVLIDEAQDFPSKVFEVVYKITKDPKRIVIAYDDFQSLKNLKIREFSDLFGKDSTGNYRFSEDSLSGEYSGGIRKDFILPNCYRNPRNILMIAHGIALGIKRKSGVVDSIDRVSDWEALGYQVVEPRAKNEIVEGDHVVVERTDQNSKNSLERLIKEHEGDTDKLINVSKYDDQADEIDFIATKIKSLISDHAVKPHEIYVIAINTRYSEDFLKSVRARLNQHNIDSIMPGFVESNRHFFEEGSVVLTTPFRAKGNESNIVFVANCESVTSDVTFQKRNSFFVSLTRSRGWCYVSGTGVNMDDLKNEIEAIQNEMPQFSYIRPSDVDIARKRLILSKMDNNSKKIQEQLESIMKENPELLQEYYIQSMKK